MSIMVVCSTTQKESQNIHGRHLCMEFVSLHFTSFEFLYRQIHHVTCKLDLDSLKYHGG